MTLDAQDDVAPDDDLVAGDRRDLASPAQPDGFAE